MARFLRIAGILLLLSLTLAAPAAASHVQCGDTITQDTTLDSDLHCPGNGLVIGADDVTVDLGGHLLAAETLFSVGVDNSAGYDRVEITNGTIRAWHGIVADGASGMTVRDTSVASYQFGIAFANASGGAIEHNTSTALGAPEIVEGIRVVASQGVSVVHNAASDVGTAIGVGISSFGCDVEDNTVTGAGHQAIVLGPGGSHVVRNNVVTGMGLPQTSWNYGLDLVASSDNLVEKNFVAGKQSFGLAVEDGSQRNVIRKNTMRGSDLFGIFVERSSDNLFDKNEALGGRLDGIQVFDPSGPNQFRRNEASGNGRDGIRVVPAGQTLTADTANSNGELGINAGSGTIDGGGNKAGNNGNPAQCVGVKCK